MARLRRYTVYFAVLFLFLAVRPAMAGAPQTGTVVNCTSSVNVRSGPGTSYSKLGTAKKGAQYPVNRASGAWYEIVYNGKTGFISSQYLSVTDDAAPEPDGRTGTVVNCTSNVNVRSGPGTSYAKLGTAQKGATYAVVTVTGDWVAVVYNGKTGYISGQYLSLTGGSEPAPEPGGDTCVIVNCTSSVNVRSGPGTSYSKLGTAQKGASYAVVKVTGDWVAIVYNGKTGYVFSDYASLSSGTAEEPQGPIIAGYYASWSGARAGYTPLDIPGDLLTHVEYAFANIDKDYKIALGYPNTDPGSFAKLRQLKAKYPHLKTLISVGGWTWSGRFSDMASTDARRSAFADSAVAFIKKYGFDGVDIDWEFPVSGGLPENKVRAADKGNFTLLMKTLREKLDAAGKKDGVKYLLSFAGASGTFYAQNVELDKVAQYADFATIMAYDMHGPWKDSYTDFNAPLYTPTEASPQYQWSCADSVELWRSAGFPDSKMVLGVPFYGVVFHGVKNANNGLYQTFSDGKSIPYDELRASYLGDASFARFTHPDAHALYLFNGETFLSFDDAATVAEKAAFIKASGIRGAGIWELTQNKDGTLLRALSENLK